MDPLAFLGARIHISMKAYDNHFDPLEAWATRSWIVTVAEQASAGHPGGFPSSLAAFALDSVSNVDENLEKSESAVWESCFGLAESAQVMELRKALVVMGELHLGVCSVMEGAVVLKMQHSANGQRSLRIHHLVYVGAAAALVLVVTCLILRVSVRMA